MSEADIVVTGASGFVGRHFINSVPATVKLRALIRECRARSLRPNVEWIIGDLSDSSTLERLLVPGCTVVNLAFAQAGSNADAAKASRALLSACVRRGVARVVHCSTVSVYGRTAGGVIDERTPCNPIDAYGAQKLAIEQAMLEGYQAQFDLAILRPAAIFGMGGKALLTLCNALRNGSELVNYGRSVVFGSRHMHLVRVDVVASALHFLCRFDGALRGDVFNITEDECVSNNFRDVEILLRSALGVGEYPVPGFSLPPALLSTLLRLRGRSEIDPLCVYESQKIKHWGFIKGVGFEAALTAFAHAYVQRYQHGAWV